MERLMNQLMKLIFLALMIFSASSQAETTIQLQNFFAKCTLVSSKVIATPGLSEANKSSFEGANQFYSYALSKLTGNNAALEAKIANSISPGVSRLDLKQQAAVLEDCASRTSAMLGQIK